MEWAIDIVFYIRKVLESHGRHRGAVVLVTFLGSSDQPAAPISPCCLDAGTLELLQVNQQPAATPDLHMQDNRKALSS